MAKTRQYKGEKVKILEDIGGYQHLWIPSRQTEIAIKKNKRKI
jgi:hypothetical protein